MVDPVGVGTETKFVEIVVVLVFLLGSGVAGLRPGSLRNVCVPTENRAGGCMTDLTWMWPGGARARQVNVNRGEGCGNQAAV